jgi:hypothetical protein
MDMFRCITCWYPHQALKNFSRHFCTRDHTTVPLTVRVFIRQSGRCGEVREHMSKYGPVTVSVFLAVIVAVRIHFLCGLVVTYPAVW